ncbi:hypothetical protein FW778_18575 [Ginsengibacter hankyongi]|uniref:6-phosphogluconate dehydrogenase n=1 Tax=Ginsengibacter hankyongi TaxID=2607284 RepID=A0A5J5ICV6_9BACT|nr:hypothetical protein [Ginsengibacter hankyongi]KAA9036618.1 hypothetical protein FW778_18575 [Ginsengibacter hankyongi]
MRRRNFFTYFIIIIIAGLGIFFYTHFYWQFGSGTKAGTLNTFMRKGYVFKTYEGKIIQSGFKANVQSNEFNFSVTKESVAQTLLNNAGREVEVHYIEYFGALPWRGMEKYIVDSVYEVRGSDTKNGISPK